MTESLTIALVIALGWALSYRAKWRRAERQLTHSEQTSQFRAKLIDNQDRTIVALLEKVEEKDRLWKDMKSRYLDSLDEIAALRDGSAAE